MAYFIQTGNSFNVPTQHYICDTDADFEELETLNTIPIGSTCLIINESSVYQKGENNWFLLNNSSDNDNNNEVVVEPTDTGVEIIECTTSAAGEQIFTVIENLEADRRSIMSEETKEIESIVIYTSQGLLNSLSNFICVGLIDGQKKNSSFFYRENPIAGNFYVATVPQSYVTLNPGTMLVRTVLYTMVYYAVYDGQLRTNVWHTKRKDEVIDEEIVTVPSLPKCYDTWQDFENDTDTIFNMNDTIYIDYDSNTPTSGSIIYKMNSSNEWELVTTDAQTKYLLINRE